MYTESELRSIIKQGQQHNLMGWETVQKYHLCELMNIYNGAGPDAWPEVIRELLTKLMSKFKPVILIHDVQFNESDGTRETFNYVVECWIRNSRLVFEAQYPLWTVKILNPDYRREREYWWCIMVAGNKAISSKAAFEAWQAAFQKQNSKSNKGIKA